MTFDRRAALPRGHRFYTSARTLHDWGGSGPHAAADETYESRGRRCTWPSVPGDWTTSETWKPEHQGEPLKKAPPQHWLGGQCGFPKSYTLRAEWSAPPKGGLHQPPRRHASTWVRPNDGPTAAWLAERDAAGTETDYAKANKRAAGTRIERALVKSKSPTVIALRRVRELMRLPETAANDNRPVDGGDNPGTGLELIHNQGSIKPSPGALIRSLSDGLRAHVITQKKKDSGAGENREIGLRVTGGHTVRGGWHLIGTVADGKLKGVIFENGELIAYGNKDGKRRKPSYRPEIAEAEHEEESATAQHLAAQPSEDLAYIKLGQKKSTPPSAANDNVKRLPDGVAWGYGRLAGISEMKGVGEGGSSAPMHDALAEIERADTFADAGINERDLDIVTAVLDDESFRTIGLRYGYAGPSSHRSGRRLVTTALERIGEKIAA